MPALRRGRYRLPERITATHSGGFIKDCPHPSNGPRPLPKVRAVVLDNLCKGKSSFGSPPDWVINDALERANGHGGKARSILEEFWDQVCADPERYSPLYPDTAATTRVVTSHKLISDLPIRGCRVPGCTSYNCAVQGRPHCCKQQLKMRAWAAQQPATHERSVVLDNLCRDKRAFGSPPDWAIDDALERAAGHGGKARAILQLEFNAEMFNAANAANRENARVRSHLKRSQAAAAV